MDRTDTLAYTLSRLLIRSLGPSTIKDKNAKEMLLTVLWCNFWDAAGNFPEKVEFTRDHFSLCDFLTQHWSSLDLVHWQKSSKSLLLGDNGKLLLNAALKELEVVHLEDKVIDLETRVSDIRVQLADLREMSLNWSMETEKLRTEVRKLRRSSIGSV
jgi:hypothetical protein